MSLGFGQSHCIRLRIGQDRPTQHVYAEQVLMVGAPSSGDFALEDVGPKKSPESGFLTERDHPEPSKTFLT